MSSARPGRHVSLFTVLGSSLLVGFAIIMSSLLWAQYQLSRQVINNETEQSLRHNHALLRSVVYGQLALVKDQLNSLAQSLANHPSGLSLANTDALHQQFKGLSGRTDADFIVTANLDASSCTQLAGKHLQLDSRCNDFLSLVGSDLQDWHLGLIGPESPQVVAISRAPLVSDDGELLGYLYGGITLSDNFSLINQAMSLSAKTTEGIAISFQHQIIACSAPNGSDNHHVLAQAAQQPGKLLQHGIDQHVAMSQKFNLGPKSDLEIHLVSLIRTDGLLQLQQGLIRQSSITIAFAIMLSTLIGMLALRLSLTPLKRLHRWATQRDWQDPDNHFNPGFITEFQMLGKELAQIVSTLKRTQSDLCQKTEQLELSHQEQRQLTERNRSLLHQLYSLQEQERKHLAQELHDELGQPLAIINTDAYLIKKQNQPDSPAYSYAESIQQSTRLMSDVVYNRIVSLRPMPLNDLGLAEAIRHMPAISALQNQGVEIEFKLSPDLPRLDDQVAIQLYRITQESLTNALKHSRAERVLVQLSLQEQTLELSIIDDGTGFNASQITGDCSHGVNGMVERAKAIGGNITIGPHRNQGTRVQVQVKLEASNGLTSPLS